MNTFKVNCFEDLYVLTDFVDLDKAIKLIEDAGLRLLEFTKKSPQYSHLLSDDGTLFNSHPCMEQDTTDKKIIVVQLSPFLHSNPTLKRYFLDQIGYED
jgi:hypothetical protein